MNGKISLQHPAVGKVLTQWQKPDNTVSIFASLDVEFNNIPFHLDTKDGKAILKFDKWSGAVNFFMQMRKHASDFPSLMSDIRHFLDSIELTVYLQNSRLAIIGPQAGFFLPYLFSIATRFNSK